MESVIKKWKNTNYVVPLKITATYLDNNPEIIFIYGDNTIHRGLGGAASLRFHQQAIGFITKKFPNNADKSFYRPEEYKPIFDCEREKLMNLINNTKDCLFVISKLGGGFANKYHIYEEIIEPWLQSIKDIDNVLVLF